MYLLLQEKEKNNQCGSENKLSQRKLKFILSGYST